MFIQAVLIGIFCYLGALSVPWAFGLTGGWYTLSRPLVSGLIVGMILGDVKTGIIVGVAVQAVYIALVTPGGTMPSDLNFAISSRSFCESDSFKDAVGSSRIRSRQFFEIAFAISAGSVSAKNAPT